MKQLLLMCLVLMFAAACSLFGDKSDEGGSSKPPRSRGVFHPGPYTDPSTGKTCNAPGGFCENDKRCHSSAEKCPLK